VRTMEESKAGFDVGYEGHQHRQARLGLELTPAQRLAWLESKLLEIRSLLGVARRPPTGSPPRPAARLP